MPRPVTPTPQLRMTQPRVIRNRHLRHPQPRPRRRDHDLRRKLHPITLQPHPLKRIPRKRPHPTMRIRSLQPKQTIQQTRQHRITQIPIQKRHRPRQDRPRKPRPQHIVITLQQRTNQPMQLKKVIRIIRIPNHHNPPHRRLNPRQIRPPIPPPSLTHNPRTLTLSQLHRPINRPVITNHHLPPQTRPLNPPPRPLHTPSDTDLLIQTRHHHRQINPRSLTTTSHQENSRPLAGSISGAHAP